MPDLPNGRKAPAKKKSSYSAKLKHYATNEANAAKRGKKPSSIASKGAVKKQTAGPRKSLPGGYKVPSKLLKNTAANKKAGLPSLADVLKKQDKKIAAYNAAKKPKAKPATKAKKSSDWEAGMSVRDWARGQDWYKGRK